MSKPLDEALAHAYHKAQVEQDRADAVKELKATLTEDDALTQEAAAELVRVAAVVEARPGADHVSEVLYGLLTSALGDAVPTASVSVGKYAFVEDPQGGLSIRSPDGTLTRLVVET